MDNSIHSNDIYGATQMINPTQPYKNSLSHLMGDYLSRLQPRHMMLANCTLVDLTLDSYRAKPWCSPSHLNDVAIGKSVHMGSVYFREDATSILLFMLIIKKIKLQKLGFSKIIRR